MSAKKESTLFNFKNAKIYAEKEWFIYKFKNTKIYVRKEIILLYL